MKINKNYSYIGALCSMFVIGCGNYENFNDCKIKNTFIFAILFSKPYKINTNNYTNNVIEFNENLDNIHIDDFPLDSQHDENSKAETYYNYEDYMRAVHEWAHSQKYFPRDEEDVYYTLDTTNYYRKKSNSKKRVIQGMRWLYFPRRTHPTSNLPRRAPKL